MARNEEKQYGRLNRLHLQQQREEQLKKKPPRPRLHTLNTVSDVKKWLPSITRDIDFSLKQSEVSCYPESKIQEYREAVQQLQGEYWAFVRKIKLLDPQCDVVPWTERGYSSRKRSADPATSVTRKRTSRLNDCAQENGSSHCLPGSDMTASERLILPLVDSEEKRSSTKRHCQPDVFWNCLPESQNRPLEFIGQTNTDQDKPLQFIGQTPTDQDKPLQFTQLHRVTCHMKEVYSAAMSSRQDASQQSEEDEDMEILEPSVFEGEQSLLPNGRVGTNPLGIDYESSSSSSS